MPTLRGLRRGLGDASPTPDRSQYDLCGQLLQQSNAQIRGLEQSLITAQQQGNSDYINQMASPIISARQRYQTLLQAYVYSYGTAFGPPDMTGLQLGQWQVYVVAGVAIGAVIAGIYELNKYLNNVQAQAQALQAQAAANQAQQSNITYAQQQLTAAQAAGDQASAAQWQQVLQANASYQPAAPGSSASDFITQNWPWLLAGGVGLLLVTKL